MAEKLQYDFYQTGNSLDKAIVAIHGWQGDRNSMRPLIKSMKIQNAGWYLMEAPYRVTEGDGWRASSKYHPEFRIFMDLIRGRILFRSPCHP